MVGPTGEQDWYVSGVFAMSFINLNDTIGDYAGRANKGLKVNSAEDAIIVSEGNIDNHSARHENGGADEISVTGLSGVLVDAQKTADHASEHEAGASDELGCTGNKTNGVIRLTNPAGAANIWDATPETGAIQITLPVVAADMIFFRATVFEYADNESFEVIVFGYLDTDTPQWLRATAIITGDSPNTKRVRFCRNSDSTHWYVIIGNTDTSWGYPWIAISEFKAGHTPAITDWNSGWSMSLITSMPPYIDIDYTDARVSPEDHVGRHQNGSADELNVTGLSGDLADRQDPKNHASRHKDGDVDELDAAELAGALGVSGKVLTTNGAASYWGGISAGVAELRTSSGSISTKEAAGRFLTLPGGQYGFWPQLRHQSAGQKAAWGYSYTTDQAIETAKTEGTSWASIICLSTSYEYKYAYTRQRYVTASGEVYWIFILRDRISKDIIAAYQAPDHPCFGNGGDPDTVQHPFPGFDPALHEIIVINPDIAFMKEIYRRMPKDKDLLETLFAEYEIDEFVSPKWPDKEITVDLEYNDFPFHKQDEARVIKRKIPMPGYVKTASFKPMV